MKAIDLLNKIANGEEVPEKFKFAGQIFEKNGSYIEDEDGDSIFESMFTDFSNINDEVEIIEEDKKIEKLECYTNAILKNVITEKYDDFEKAVKHNIDVLGTKINEIIDKINKEDKRER